MRNTRIVLTALGGPEVLKVIEEDIRDPGPGELRVQVLAHGFQTYGDDFEIGKGKTEITIKLKRPQGQFSIYEDHGNDANAQPKSDAPPADAKKPN